MTDSLLNLLINISSMPSFCVLGSPRSVEYGSEQDSENSLASRNLHFHMVDFKNLKNTKHVFDKIK